MVCPNCANEHAGEFCNACGQRNVDLHVPIGGLVREAAEEALVEASLQPFLEEVRGRRS